MSQDFFKKMSTILAPRFREEGPPSYVEKFIGDELFDTNGKAREPMKTVLDLIVVGYRPVTTLCILAAFVEEKNRPCSGRQLGMKLEKRLELEEGKLTQGRYYDDRIGRLLKIMCELGVLEREDQTGKPSSREGYRIKKELFPTLERKIEGFLKGGSLSPFDEGQSSSGLEEVITKLCSGCHATITSQGAIFCELCGAPLQIACGKCGKEVLSKWGYCNHCGAPLLLPVQHHR